MNHTGWEIRPLGWIVLLFAAGALAYLSLQRLPTQPLQPIRQNRS